MRLTIKLTFAFLAVCVVVFTVNAQRRINRERSHFEEQRYRSHRVFGDLVASTVAEVRVRRGLNAAREVLHDAQPGGAPVRLRLVCAGPGEAPLPPGVTCDSLRAQRFHAVRSVIERDDPRQLAHFTYITVPVEGAGPQVLEIRESLEGEQDFMQTSIEGSVKAAVSIVLVCVLASFVLGLAIVGVPTRRLIAKAERVGRGDLTGPLALRQNDELGDLARAMDAMCDQLAAARERAEAEARARLRAFEQLRHAERLTTVGKLASGLAHEIGTPLNVIEARASNIADGAVQGDRVKTSARAIVDAVERITRIVRALLDFARRKGEGVAPVEVRALLESAAEFLAPMAARRRVRVETALATPGARVHGDALQLGQAVTNLVMNALQASPEGEAVTVEEAVVDVTPPPNVESGGPFVRISVSDRGPGVAPEHRDRVFEPFFTTKDVGEGTGLGLSVAWGIAAEHGGWIALEDRPGGGSIFMLYLPALGG